MAAMNPSETGPVARGSLIAVRASATVWAIGPSRSPRTEIATIGGSVVVVVGAVVEVVVIATVVVVVATVVEVEVISEAEEDVHADTRRAPVSVATEIRRVPAMVGECTPSSRSDDGPPQAIPESARSSDSTTTSAGSVA